MARRVRSRRIGVGAIAVLVLGLGLTGLAPARQAFSQRQRVEAEQRKLAALEAENRKLDDRLRRLNDPDYIEKLAREQLGLVRPGEISYVVVPPPETTQTAVAPKPKPRSAPARAWDWLKSLVS